MQAVEKVYCAPEVPLTSVQPVVLTTPVTIALKVHHWTWTQVLLIILILVLYLVSIIFLQMAAVATFRFLLAATGNFSAYVAINIATAMAAVSLFVVPVIVLLSWIGDSRGWGLWNLLLFTYGLLFMTTLIALAFLVSAVTRSSFVQGLASFWVGLILMVLAEVLLLVLIILSW